MNETSKSIFRKLNDSRYATRYLVGHGIDIGAGQDSLNQYLEFFPLAKSCRSWDLDDGDAQLLNSISDNVFDFVHSSHCLEHMADPIVALNNWLRVLRPGGHLIILVPDEDLYEQGIFPSIFNSDHKHSFTIYKKESWSNFSLNLIDLLSKTISNTKIIKIELLDSTFRYNFSDSNNAKNIDQSMTPVGECSIEMVIKKL
jgi:SAM-dependent methyltransferase